MLWPYSGVWIDTKTGSVYVYPIDFIAGISSVIPHWICDQSKKDEAYALLGTIVAAKVYTAPEYKDRTEILVEAASYATLGTAHPDGCDFCIDTLKALVP